VSHKIRSIPVPKKVLQIFPHAVLKPITHGGPCRSWFTDRLITKSPTKYGLYMPCWELPGWKDDFLEVTSRHSIADKCHA
jgi:hypothetical protein